MMATEIVAARSKAVEEVVIAWPRCWVCRNGRPGHDWRSVRGLLSRWPSRTPYIRAAAAVIARAADLSPEERYLLEAVVNMVVAAEKRKIDAAQPGPPSRPAEGGRAGREIREAEGGAAAAANPVAALAAAPEAAAQRCLPKAVCRKGGRACHSAAGKRGRAVAAGMEISPGRSRAALQSHLGRPL